MFIPFPLLNDSVDWKDEGVSEKEKEKKNSRRDIKHQQRKLVVNEKLSSTCYKKCY